ncbi:MAG: tRNA epoxyqueuosine(34) reductase QueG [Planctomycetota bacterium]
MSTTLPEHDRLARLAAAHGFEVVGVTDASVLGEDLARLRAWVDAGHGAELAYMTRNPPQRADPRTLLASVRSVVSVAVAYPHDAGPFEHEGRYGRIARYAWGRDYHALVRPRLDALACDIAAAFGGTRARGACDHSPLLERAVAARAGLGFVGKNTCLILPRRGSWWFLGEVLVDAEIPATSPADGERHCGTCVRCLEACPTQAFPAPYVVDARRCISYLTIEHAGEIPEELRSGIGPWLFGCDVCQEVCPFQREHSPTPWPELMPEAGVGPRVDLGEVLALDDAAFVSRFGGTPLQRPGRVGLQRNALVVAANIGAVDLRPSIDRLLRAPEPALRIHAADALSRLA